MSRYKSCLEWSRLRCVLANLSGYFFSARFNLRVKKMIIDCYNISSLRSTERSLNSMIVTTENEISVLERFIDTLKAKMLDIHKRTVV